MTSDFSLPMAAELLVPHKAPFRLITRLLEFGDQAGVAEAVLTEDNILINEDRSLEPLTLIELIAQSYAAVKGYDERSKGGKVLMGFLVDVRNFKFDSRCYVGDRLIIKVQTVGTMGGFTVARGDVICKDKTVASGRIKLWVPDGFESGRDFI